MPRPTTQQRSKSLQALLELLHECASAPKRYLDSSISAHLDSQGQLARFEDPARGISHCSLNTMKTTAKFLLPGGFDTVNDAREKAHQAIRNAQRPTTPKRASSGRIALQAQIQDVRQELQIALQDLLLLQRAYRIRCKQARSYAADSNNPAILARCEAEQRQSDLGLTLVSKKDARVGDSLGSNVHPIEAGL